MTALILVPMVIGAVIWLPSDYLAVAVAVVILQGAWEWSLLAGLSNRGARLLYLLLISIALFGLWRFDSPLIVLMVLVIACLWWLIQAFRLLWVRQVARQHGFSLSQAGAGLLVLIPSWLALFTLHRQGDWGPVLVLFLLILTWVADTLAYFAGRRWGRHKLAPLVSPGKTREGAYGAMVGALVCGATLAWQLADSPGQGIALVVLCLATAMLSILGDLRESLLKRQRGAKDSGNLLPGHGGVLDRIDSLTAAAPVFAVGILWLGGLS
jgi:phosphatidate cytidylyltransferase